MPNMTIGTTTVMTMTTTDPGDPVHAKALSALEALGIEYECLPHPAVYTIELSSQKVASAIAETTGARILTFHSCQTLTRQEFDRGETYLSLMWKNVDVLKEGLS